MIKFLNKSKESISAKDLFKYYRNIYLIIRSAEKKKIDCQVLLRAGKSKDIVYLRLAKKNKVRWFGSDRGFFNSKSSCDLCLYKDLTHSVLKFLNFPVIDLIRINNIKQLNKLKIKSPWVLKPVTGTQGKDIILKIDNIKILTEYCKKLLKKYPDLIIEKFVPGNDFRLIVLKNKFLGALKRNPPFIKGDGQKNIKNLIDIENKKRYYIPKDFNSSFLKPLEIDLELINCLKNQNLNLKSIPQKNKLIKLRENANFSTGGTVEDVTNKVHPKNKKIALQAVKALGLEIGGVDIITNDISKPITKNNAKIIEINSSPGLWIHHYPNKGKSRDIAGKIINYLFGH